jgi:AI-2 transport protein TqsA
MMRLTDSRIQTDCLAVLATIAIGFTLHSLRAALLPFVLAVFFICGISPILDLMQRLRLPRFAAVAFTLAVGLMIIAMFWGMIWVSVSSLVADAPIYRQRVEQIVDHASEALRPFFPEAAFSLTDTEEAESSTSLSMTEGVREIPRISIRRYFATHFQTVVQKISAGLFELLGSAVMVSIFMFFLLVGNARSANSRPIIWKEVESQIREYIVLKTLISAATGFAVWISLWCFGIPLAMALGLLAFLLNFIPNIGPLIMCFLPLPLIILNPQLSVLSMITVVMLMFIIQFFSGNVLEPKIMGSSFNLHPVVIMLTLLLWGVIWGIPGMFLSTPITAAIKIVMEKFEYTKPIARLMSGEW